METCLFDRDQMLAMTMDEDRMQRRARNNWRVISQKHVDKMYKSMQVFKFESFLEGLEY